MNSMLKFLFQDVIKRGIVYTIDHSDDIIEAIEKGARKVKDTVQDIFE